MCFGILRLHVFLCRCWMKTVNYYKPYRNIRAKERLKNVCSEYTLYIKYFEYLKNTNNDIVLCCRYQQILHRNLVYLASIADSSQNIQALLPVSFMYLFKKYSTFDFVVGKGQYWDFMCFSQDVSNPHKSWFFETRPEIWKFFINKLKMSWFLEKDRIFYTLYKFRASGSKKLDLFCILCIIST